MMYAKYYSKRKWGEGGRKEHKVETNYVRVWDKKNYKNHIITSKDSLSVTI